MLSLFPDEPAFPEGFSYIPDFISDTEEKSLLDAISKIELQTFVFQGYEAKRKFASFGFDYSFTHRKLNRDRRDGVGFLGNNDCAVVKDMPGRSETSGCNCRQRPSPFTGVNHPTVR